MTSTLRIQHRTNIHYDGPVSHSFDEVRMTPLYSESQLIRRTAISVTPQPWQYSYVDYWGTQVTSFEIHEPHQRLTITADSTLDVVKLPHLDSGMTLPKVGAGHDRWYDYVLNSPVTDPGQELRERTRELVDDTMTINRIGHTVSEMIHEQVRYVPGSTRVDTTAQQAWEARSGVCQDIAHLVIGCLRSLGIPTRYVSGYVLPRNEAEPGEPVDAQTHAWVQWWDGAWTGFDPTNLVDSGESHARVGTGREYADVAPFKGVFTGAGSTSTYEASVVMRRLS
ncbi:MAG: transglutaminase family protein [Acidipropionibacterium acidipropionici]|jgi:transglutaminase-like putative cysteine protease|uniref:transglutaminase family protein n=1 Tax=Acidipropionibacterium acidipropionici TaxID=1748 RepID=UPI002F3577B9